MTLKKIVSPFDVFSEISRDNWDRCSELMHFIIDNRKEETFNFYIETEVFPNGVEIEEFKDFCLNHQSEILCGIA